jgi:hypothetical protein
MPTTPPAITDVVPESRLARYREVAGADLDDLAAFYRWSGRLALALFADIAALEVAMRSAMARELVRVHGLRWFARDDLFDDDCTKLLTTAWVQGGLGRLEADGVAAEVLEGKLVAALMFGFWVKLLGRGSHAGRAPFRRRRVYDTSLWRPALAAAFPHAPTRVDAERLSRTIQATRNRIAHHEHIVWGVPLPGQHKRLAVATAHDNVLTLAGFISPATRTWVARTSETLAVVAACPVDSEKLTLG